MNNNIDYSRYDNRGYVKNWVDIYNGNPSWVNSKVRPSNISNAVVNILSNGILSDVTSEVVGGPRSEYVNNQYQRFLKQARPMIELLLVQGSLILKPFNYMDKLGVEIIPASNFIPLKFNEMGDLVDVIFIEYLTKNGRVFTKVERHTFDVLSKKYEISHKAYEGEIVDFRNLQNMREINISLIDEWSGIANGKDVVIEDIDRPLFVYVKTPYTNVARVNLQIGVSLLSLINEHVKNYDVLNSLMMRDFKATSTRVFISEQVAIDNSTGKVSEDFLEEDLKGIYYMFPSDSGEFKSLDSMIQIVNGPTKVNEYTSGLQNILREIERSSGLAFGDLSEGTAVLQTATAVLSSKQRKYQTIKDFQLNSVEEPFKELVKVLFNMVDIFDLVKEKKHEDYEFVIDFGKGIIDGIEVEKLSKANPEDDVSTSTSKADQGEKPAEEVKDSSK